MRKLQTYWQFIWPEVNKLVKAIQNDFRKPKMVIGISRGGLVPAAMIARQMSLPLMSVETGENLEQYNQHSTCLLIVDDIYDSGVTLNTLYQSDTYKQHIYVCLYNKNLNPIGMKQPDYAINIHTKQWVVFPWESEDD